VKAGHVAESAVLDEILALVGDDDLVESRSLADYRDMLRAYMTERKRQGETCPTNADCSTRRALARAGLLSEDAAPRKPPTKLRGRRRLVSL